MCTTLCGDKKVICMQIKTESLCSNIYRYQSHALIHILNLFISHLICTSLQISAPFYSGAVCFIFAGWPNGRRVGWRQHYFLSFYSLIPPLLNPLNPHSTPTLEFFISIFKLRDLNCLLCLVCPILVFTCLCSLDLCPGIHRCRYPDRIWNRFLVIQSISIFSLSPHQSLYLDLQDHHHIHILNPKMGMTVFLQKPA